MYVNQIGFFVEKDIDINLQIEQEIWIELKMVGPNTVLKISQLKIDITRHDIGNIEACSRRLSNKMV